MPLDHWLRRRPARWDTWQPYVFALTPFVATVIAALLDGTFHHRGCGPGRTFAVIFGPAPAGPPCQSLPLLADLPSLFLACSAALGVFIFWRGQEAWTTLPSRLEATGVLAPGKQHLFELVPGQRWERALDAMLSRRRYKVGVLLGVVLVGLAFYAITYNGGYLFRDYAMSQHLGQTRTPVPCVGAATPGGSRRLCYRTVTDQNAYQGVRQMWWANWRRHPGMAAMWVLVGVAGVYAAVLDLMSFMRRTLILRRLRGATAWRFVPGTSRSSHPLEPLIRLANLRIWGFVTFLMTLTVLVYLARAPHPGGTQNVVLALIALGVMVSTVSPLRLYWMAATDAYEAGIRRELELLLPGGKREEELDDLQRIYVVLRRTEIRNSAVRPLLSSLSGVTRAIAILGACAGFLASIVTISLG